LTKRSATLRERSATYLLVSDLLHTYRGEICYI
jgi:hypothetical protein